MKTRVTVEADASALLAYLELLTKRAEELRVRFFDLPNLPKELARFHVDDLTATTGQLRVSLYPSDALLRFAATLRALDGDGLIVE